MAEFLSAEWIAALDAAARASPALASCSGDSTFVLEQRVARPDGSEAVHHMLFAASGARVRPGAAPRPDLVLLADLETAISLARGTVTAQHALADGALRIRGDLAALASRGEALRAVDDVFATTRAATTYPSINQRKPRR